MGRTAPGTAAAKRRRPRICRKVIEAMDTGKKEHHDLGRRHQTRSFMYIDDCVTGIDKIMHCDELIATPINLGSSELVSINELLTKIEKIAGVKLNRNYDLDAPQGVAGRNSDNTFIKKILSWEPGTTLDEGLAETYEWIKEQYARSARRANAWASADEKQRHVARRQTSWCHSQPSATRGRLD